MENIEEREDRGLFGHTRGEERGHRARERVEVSRVV